jgi:hypothetical protein
LAGVLQNVDNAIVAVFEIDRFAIGYQMEVRFPGQNLVEAPLRLLVEKPKHTADFLQRETLPAQFCDNCNLNYFLRQIDPLVRGMTGGYYLSLVPPLELAQTYLRDSGYFTTRERSLGRTARIRTRLFCFEH